MDQSEQVYIKLQRHLDSQTMGFPATRSGSERRVLRHIFTPREAEIATCLTHKFEPLDRVFERARHLVESPKKLEELLDRIEQKGGIESKIKDGKKHYCNLPLIVGMFELQLDKLTPEFLKEIHALIHNSNLPDEKKNKFASEVRNLAVKKSQAFYSAEEISDLFCAAISSL